MELGLIHIYSGDGKGKTTAAVGLALRAASSGLQVLFAQFLKEKSEPSSELIGLERCGNITIRRHGGNLLGAEGDSETEIRAAVQDGLDQVLNDVINGAFDVVVLDEINVALALGLADIEIVRQIINACKGRIELILTGRNAPESIMQRADYITEFLNLRHPYGQGIQARKGIEF